MSLAPASSVAGMPLSPREDLLCSLTEGLAPRDRFTRRWLEQVMLRMRRELCWLWRKHQPADRFADSLERQSLAGQRLQFFAEDITARFLDEQIRAGRPPERGRGRTGLPWLARELNLSRAEIFVVAFVFAAARDAAVGALIAALEADARRQLPSLGLAQALWDEPRSLIPLLSPAHPLFTHSILRRAEGLEEWNAPISMPALVAGMLEVGLHRPPAELELAARPNARDDRGVSANSDSGIAMLAYRIAPTPQSLEIVPTAPAFASDVLDARRAAPTLEKIASLTGRPVYSLRPNVAATAAILENAGVYCWMKGADLLLPGRGLPADVSWRNTLRPFPIYVFADAPEDGAAPLSPTLPTLKIHAPNYEERIQIWQREVQQRGLNVPPEGARECAYRFRLDAAAIAEIAATLGRIPPPITLDRMLLACRQQVGQSIGIQATLVPARFRREELVLDPEHGAQFDRLLSAMRSLSRVHAEWGTGHAWGDAGISALFAGAPGTGKTMAAEILAGELQLPMYRVDLSQVVNKYIGETEKNLRRLFDAAEQADLVLFFDEAEALFGQRLQARNSNDRFANIEISYLLERMDRFRGLAILATNRKKDLDEAFLRRLRYVIEFPLPGERERLEIWRKSIPPQVSMDAIDLELLAHEFALAGGNIRSIVFNACLDAASRRQRPALTMEAVIAAIDREYEKLGRPLTGEQKRHWQPLSSGAMR